jgi:NAD-dependent SIR2 family protein deacetylase
VAQPVTSIGQPLSAEDELLVDSAAEILRGKKVAVLTGAGLSTDSGIPDYRGKGAPARSPMTFNQFLADLDYRKRYWAGSQLGWRRFDAAQPNAGHRALASLELDGRVNGVITQNVDGLHLRAGSQRVVDLHGTMDRVRCLRCGQLYARTDISARLEQLNPWLAKPESVQLGPDGDVEIESVEEFELADCSACGGMLKPDIVFFGEFIPREKFIEASALVQKAEALIIAGSSLVVNSGIRLLDHATRRRIPVIILNRGVTKGDTRATLKIDAGASETLVGLLDRLVR